MTTTADAIADLARRCYETYQTKDRAALERLLADDFTFTSPYDDHIDRATYFERCWPNAGTFERYQLLDVVVHGDSCWVLYEGKRRGSSWFRNTEKLRIAGDKIASVEVFFGLPPHTAPTVPPSTRDPRSESSRSAWPDPATAAFDALPTNEAGATEPAHGDRETR